MAQAFSAEIARERLLELTVESAGTLDGDRLISADALEVIAASGIDMSTHSSRLLDAATIGRADLVLGMTREHVREVVLVDPSAWPRTFTLKELVRRAEATGPRSEGRSLSQWLSAVGHARRREELMGWSSADDVIDPAGGTPEQLRATADELRDLVRRLVELIDPEKRVGLGPANR
jgi:protein-tyrosine phosphatase